jgi:phage/plasmid-like protein (TIGR03299 family)
MADEIEQAARRDDTAQSWHGLETTMTREEARDLDTFMVKSGIFWTAEKSDVVIRRITKLPVFDKDGVTMLEAPEFEYIEAPDYAAVLRSTDRALLGIHGSDYQVHNPKDVLAPIHSAVLNDERFAWNFGTSLRGGKIITAVADFLPGLEVAGDKHEAYLFCTTSFDGTRATTMGGTTVRIVCANTLRMAMDSKETKRIVMKHRSAIEGRASQLIQQIETTVAGYAAYKEIGEALAMHRVEKGKAKDMLTALLFEPKEVVQTDVKGKQFTTLSTPSTRTEGRIDKLIQSFETSLNERGGESTVYAMLQGVTRFADHERGTRMTKGRESRGETEEQVRFDSNLIGNSDKFKQDAFKVLLAQVPELQAA